MRRKQPPRIPELSEVEVMRHFFRLSQESTCVDSGFNAEGTCTMKYNPKINEALAGSSKVANLHPLSEFTECLIMAAYHRHKGNDHKTDLIVPYTSHGTNAVGAKMAGFNVVTIDQTDDGNLDLEAFNAALSDRTAGMIQTNPTSLSIFDTNLLTMADMIHEVGGIFAYDAANTNSVMGRARPRDLKFDLVHYNAHKAFSSPHGGYGPGMGVVVVSEELAPFLPSPVVGVEGGRYFLDFDRPLSIGRIKQFYGNVPNAVRAYAWILAMGPAGIAAATDIAVLNNNYILHKMKEIRGITVPMAEGRKRMEETVFSLKQILDDTGVGAHHFALRVADFGPNSTFTLGYPPYVEEPWVIEPTETMDKAEIDNFIDIVRRVSAEVYDNPETILKGPQNCAVGEIDMAASEDPKTMALTWRMYCKKGLKF
jgi:glycine dehydrogenase subunit 2